MSKKTRRFLTRLGEDPEVLERFRKEPHAVMDEHEVPKDHQKLIVSKDAKDRDKLKQDAELEDAHTNFIIL